MKFSFLPALGTALVCLLSAGTTHAQAPANKVAAKDNHSASIHADGTLWTWGSNWNGQLGDGTTMAHTQAVQVVLPGTTGPADPLNKHWAQVAAGSSHTLALSTDGTLYAWGNNSDGQLGTGDFTSQLNPTKVALPDGNTRWASITAGTSHSLALTTDGRLFAWGANTVGQLGDGTTSTQPYPVAVLLPTATTVRCTQIAAGNAHSLALTSDGTLYAWGANEAGQLGDGSTTRSLVPTAVLAPKGDAIQPWASIAAGRYHSLALSADGQLYAWGSNRFGQLGTVTTTQRSRPAAVPMPTALQHTTWTQVTGGDAHTVALSADGQLYTWGNNYVGQLGNGGSHRQTRPVAVALPAGCAERWTQVSTGGFHTVAQAADGTLCTWGYNDYGQLGNGSTASPAAPACRNVPAVLLGSAAGAK